MIDEQPVRLKRQNTLARDLTFPFYTKAQFLFLAVLCVVMAGLVGLSEPADAVPAAVICWLWGHAVMTVRAPAELTYPRKAQPYVHSMLRRMGFVPTESGMILTRNRSKLRKLLDSDLRFREQASDDVLTGPLGTLFLLGWVLRRSLNGVR